MKIRYKIITIILVLFSMITPVYAAASANKNLKELVVEDHEIYFYKDRTEYSVLINEGVNTLNVKAVAEDEKAKVEIKGADDLKENDYLVTVKVTAENGNSKEYNIKAEFKKEVVVEEEKGFFDGLVTKLNEMNLKLEYFIFLAAFIVAVFLINKVIGAIRGRKIDKTMDKF